MGALTTLLLGGLLQAQAALATIVPPPPCPRPCTDALSCAVELAISVVRILMGHSAC